MLAIDEFITNGQIFEQVDAFKSNFDSVFRKYLNGIMQGISFSLFTFGSKSSGKTFALEGNSNESGVYTLLIENLFYMLDQKRNGILEAIANSGSEYPDIEATTFTYNVRMKFIELKDEVPIDLLQKFNNYRQAIQILYSESEGYSVSGASWIGISSSVQFGDIYAEAMKLKTNFEYGTVNRNATVLTLEISQMLENRTTRDVKYINSRLNIYDLPSADLLSESFRSLQNNPEYKSIFAFQNMCVELAKSHNNALSTIYDKSVLTKLMKENVGANALNLAIFTLQQNNYAISQLVFKMMKVCSQIQCFPIINDTNSNGLLKKFRVEISYLQKYSSKIILVII